MRAALLAALACGCGTAPVPQASPPVVANVAPAPPAPPAPPDAAPATEPDDETGFDLYVSQPVATWRIDGEPRTDRLPVRIRGIVTGPHEIEIDGPPGFASVKQRVDVERGKAPKITIELPRSP
jgi:hypothetical protein